MKPLALFIAPALGLSLACVPPRAPEVSAACLATEPPNDSPCGVPVGQACTYTIASVHDVHCHCLGQVWDCGTALGIDTAAPGCPAQMPKSGDTCTLRAQPASPGDRPGCFYEAPATPIVHDCFCARDADSSRARWDCGQRVGDAAYDANGCPARQPKDGSLCAPSAPASCQYGYNLATTCACNVLGDRGRAWRCVTTPQPPSP